MRGKNYFLGRKLTINLIVALFFTITTQVAYAGTYGGGTGIQADPYIVSDSSHVLELCATQADWNKYFKMTADIDMVNTTFDTPIGNRFATSTHAATVQFSGTFDGNNHVLSNLTIDVDNDNDATADGTFHNLNAGVGLFGDLTGTVKNLGIKSIFIDEYGGGATKNRVGGIAGMISSGALIENCYVLDGTVEGSGWAGAIAGVSFGACTIRNCFSNVAVAGSWSTAGLLGNINADNGTIENVAFYGTISGKPSITKVTDGKIATVNNAFYISTSGSSGDTHGTQKTPHELKLQSTYSGFDFATPVWNMKEGAYAVLSSFPITNFASLEGPKYSGGDGSVGDPFQIANATDLIELSSTSADWGQNYNFIITNDIDMTGETLTPIGTGGTTTVAFKGGFNGQGYIISNLSISDPDTHAANGIALFGQTNASTIQNLGIKNINLNYQDDERVAAFVGNAFYTTISNCYVDGGSISGRYRVGSLVGYYDGTNTISNCWSNLSLSVNPNATWYHVGGIVGTLNSGNITNCAFYGTLGSTAHRGGIVGLLTAGTITNSYFADDAGDTRAYANGGTEVTRAALSQKATYTGFDFSNTWYMNTYAELSERVTVENSDVLTISESTNINELIIESDGVVNVNPGVALNVTAITNNAGTTGLVLHSDATGTGLLNCNSTGVQASVEQFIAKDQWHYIGNPISAINVESALPDMHVASINEGLATNGARNGWSFLSAGDQLTPGTGYAVINDISTDTTVVFSGTLNTGDISTTVTYSNEGWNLVANPYPTTIDWEAIAPTNTNDAIYVYNSGTYDSYVDGSGTQGQYLAPMQAFFVKTNAADPALSFSNAHKVSNITAYKNASITPTVKITVTDNKGKSDATYLRAKSAATELFDGNLDAYKLLAESSNVPQIYTETDEMYSINTVPDFDNNNAIALKVLAKQNATHTLSLRTKNFDTNIPVLLMDINKKVLADLSKTDYEVELNEGEISDYLIGFSYSKTNSEKSGSSFVRLYSENRSIVIKGLELNSQVDVYNLAGQKITRSFAQNGSINIQMNQKGLFIINAQSVSGFSYKGKVLVK